MRINFFWQGLLVSCLFAGVFLHSIIFNLNQPIALSYVGDTFHVTLTLKHYYATLLSGHFNQILDVPMFYGFSNSLLFSELFLTQAILGLPIYLISSNILITFNLLAVITMIWSFFSMFLLAHFVTKKFLPSVLAALIYTYNPFVLGHFPDNLHYYSLQWIPLIFLFFERSLKDHNPKNLFLFFLFMTIQLLSSQTFGALLTVILPIYALVRLYQTKTPPLKLINWGAILGLVLFLLATISFGVLYSSYYSKQPIDRSLNETSFYSPWVSDLFFTPPNNLIYGGLRQAVSQIWPDFVFRFEEVTERNLFLGITPFVLLIISFKIFKSSSDKKVYWLYILLAVFCLWLSLGPWIHISYQFSLPGIYTVFHAINPLLQDLRVPSRFTFFTFLFLGLICAMVLSHIDSKFKPRTALNLSLLIIALVTLEYWSKPWTIIPQTEATKSFYSSLDKRADIGVILELPMGNLFSSIVTAKSQFVDTKYMLWASTLHSKKLLNGYSSFTPPQYPKRIEYLSVNFPTRNKLLTLKQWGVDGIVLHQEEFIDPDQFDMIRSKLKLLGVKEVLFENNLALFSLKDYSGDL